jgi:biopolymer transport protein ExbD
MKKILFTSCLFISISYSLNGQTLIDSLRNQLREIDEILLYRKNQVMNDSINKANPTVLIKIKKNGDIFFKNKRIDAKELSKELENIVWPNDDKVIVVSAEIGTQISHVTNIMGICNEKRIRIILSTK